MAEKAIIGQKIGMTQIWDESNRVVPVTVIKVVPVRIVQVKTEKSDGYCALQVTYGYKPEEKLNKPELGHFKKAQVEPGKELVELRLDKINGYAVGQSIKADIFSPGERVDVTGVSKGKGFSGTMKRHNFSGQGAAHGNHKKHRAPGSIGACATPARVFKGTRMAGRYGHSKVTTLNLEVVKADPEKEILLVKGAVPGPIGGRVILRDSVKGKK